METISGDLGLIIVPLLEITWKINGHGAWGLYIVWAALGGPHGFVGTVRGSERPLFGITH